MKGHIIFALCLIAVTGYNLEKELQSFKITHKKTYNDKSPEGKLRKKIFENNLKFIEEHNIKYENDKKYRKKRIPSITYKLEVTQFSDITYEEFLKTYASKVKLIKSKSDCKKSRGKRSAPIIGQHRPIKGKGEPPTEVDWRKKIKMSEIQSQGDCGCCWAFASIGVVEAHHTIKKGTFQKLSEQELLDCCKTDRTDGCDGGIHYESFDYILEENVTPALDYPTIFPLKGRYCNKDQMKNKVKILGFRHVDLLNPDEDELKKILAFIGPVVTSMSTPKTLMQYGKNSGVFNDPDCNNNKSIHYVIIVGYGEDPVEGPYWLIKNSWSKRWGENGYMRLARNKGNMCHIASEAFYPLV